MTVGARTKMNRRTVLLGSAGIAGACAVGYSAILAAGATQACAAEDTEAALSQHVAMVGLGASYLRQATAWERAELLDMARKPAATVLRLAAVMAARAPVDFENGNVANCDGWVLARGEARSCALIALAGAGSNEITRSLLSWR